MLKKLIFVLILSPGAAAACSSADGNIDHCFKHLERPEGISVAGDWWLVRECIPGIKTKFAARIQMTGDDAYSGYFRDILGRTGEISGRMQGLLVAHRSEIGGYAVVEDGELSRDGNQLFLYDSEGCRIEGARQEG